MDKTTPIINLGPREERLAFSILLSLKNSGSGDNVHLVTYRTRDVMIESIDRQLRSSGERGVVLTAGQVWNWARARDHILPTERGYVVHPSMGVVER